jgi:hypothetical protein
MDIVSLIISLISGALGGNIAGSVLKDQSLGPLGPRFSFFVTGLRSPAVYLGCTIFFSNCLILDSNPSGVAYPCN